MRRRNGFGSTVERSAFLTVGGSHKGIVLYPGIPWEAGTKAWGPPVLVCDGREG